jgi:hypothetical protein
VVPNSNPPGAPSIASASNTRKPTELDVSFLNYHLNTGPDAEGLVESELEEIQSQFQSRLAYIAVDKSKSNANNPSTMVNASPASGNVVKVSPRRPHNYTGDTTEDYGSEVSSVSNLTNPPAGGFGGKTSDEIAAAAQRTMTANMLNSIDSMSLQQIEETVELLLLAAKQRKSSQGATGQQDADDQGAAEVQRDGEPQYKMDEDDDEARGRPRADSIGPEIRRSKVAARHEAAAKVEREQREQVARSRDTKESVEKGGDGGEDNKEFSPERTGTEMLGTSAGRRPTIDKMFASRADGYVDEIRGQEIEEGIKLRDRDAVREQMLGNATANNTKSKSGIGAMIESDRNSINTHNDVSTSDLMSSIYSDTGSDYSDDYEDNNAEGGDGDNIKNNGTVYSKSPNGLVFYGKPRVNVPSLKLSVCRSPRNTNEVVVAPDLSLAVREISQGDKAFSPRSCGDNSENSRE